VALRGLGRAALAALATAVVSGGVAGVGAPAAHADAVGGGGDFVPLTAPFRALDTRTGLGAGSGPITPGVTRVFPVTGRSGVPAAGVSAVLVDVAVVSPAGQTYLALWGNGQPRPAKVAMTVGSTNGTVSNSAVVPVGGDGSVAISSSSASTHAAVDVYGYFTTASTATGFGGFIPVGHQRLVDTRTGLGTPRAKIPVGSSITVDLGNAAVPAVTSALINVTVPGAAGGGWLTVRPAAAADTNVSTVDFIAGNTASGAVVRLGTDHRATIANHSTQPIDVIVDVHGYFSSDAGSGAGYRPAAGRLLDTADSGTLLGPNATVDIPVRGRYGVGLDGATAVAVNLITVSATQPGFLRIWPVGGTEPGTSLGNFTAGGTARANQAVVHLAGSDSSLRVRNVSAGSIRLAVDLEGWFAGVTLRPAPQPSSPMALVQTDTDGSLVHAYVDNGGVLRYAVQAAPGPLDPASVHALGGDLRFTGKPALIELPDGRVQLVAMTSSGVYWTTTQTAPGAAAWGSPVVLGGPLAYPPALIHSHLDDPLYVLGVTQDGHLFQRAEDLNTGTYADWVDLGDKQLAGTPTVVDFGIDPDQLFVTDRSNRLQATPFNPFGPQSWTEIATNVRGDAAAVGCDAGRIRVAYRGGAGTIEDLLYNGSFNTVVSAGSMGLFGSGEPTISTDPRSGDPRIVARDSDNRLNISEPTDCSTVDDPRWQPVTDPNAGTDGTLIDYFLHIGGGGGLTLDYRTTDDVPHGVVLTGPAA
jgi:hypothetical protein